METVYPQRKNGKIVGFTRWPNKKSLNTPVDVESGEFKDFLNRPLGEKLVAAPRLTCSENIALIDFYLKNSVITTARANELKGGE